MSDRKKTSKLEKQRRTKAGDVVPTLDLKKLVDLPPWEWPREAPRVILRLLRDRLEPEADRELAVTLVGDLCEQTEDTFKAWPHVRAILRKAHQDKDLLLAAIEAAPALAPLEACEILGSYLDSKDEDISDAAMEAMSMADGDGFGEDLDEDEWEDRFFGEDGGT